MPEQCQIALKSLSLNEAKPGDTLELIGTWGSAQGEKIPVINKGSQNKLEITSWSDTIIVTRIPEHLGSGSYKVGVYCHSLSKGATRSSGFKTLILNADGQSTSVTHDELWQQYWWLPVLFLPLLIVVLSRKSDPSKNYRNRGR